jgi:hypothetical protein
MRHDFTDAVAVMSVLALQHSREVVVAVSPEADAESASGGAAECPGLLGGPVRARAAAGPNSGGPAGTIT